MNKDVNKLCEENFDFSFKAATYNNIRVAIQTFEMFKKKNESFFTFDKKETVFGHLRTYAIEKQFNDSAFNPKVNYSVSMKQVNNYKHKALCIETNDFIVNVGRTNSMSKLLPASKYKKELAKLNESLNSQFSFDFSGAIPSIVDSKKYAEITYGYEHGDITHLMIVIPSSDYKSIEFSINLLEEVQVYNNYVPEEVVEESVVVLKESLIKEAEKIV